MATTITSTKNRHRRGRFPMASETPASVSVVRAIVASALAFGIFFVLCWAGIPLKIPVSHMFVSLFTARPVETTAALFDGTIWSLGFGALIAFLITSLYNALPIGRR
jgi:hypothetical protein